MVDVTGMRAAGPAYGMGLKLASICCFVTMAAMLKACAGLPAGELVFFRSFVGIIPIVLFLAWQKELRASLHTANISGHLLRGLIGVGAMGSAFFALTKLPLPEATTIGHAAPLIMVALGALLLGERVSAARWIAVAIGLAGVLVVAWPRLTLEAAALSEGQRLGAIAALAGAGLVAAQTLTIRTLVRTERSSTIVLYYSLMSSVLAFATILFGWAMPSPLQLMLLVGAGIIGGTGQILLTEALRHAEVSNLAPLEYTSVVLSGLIGYAIFGDVPTTHMIAGAMLVVVAGLYLLSASGSRPGR